MITQFKKHPFIWSMVGVVIIGILAFIGLTNPISTASDDNEENFIKKVKTLEEIQHQLINLKTTWDESEETINNIASKDYINTYIDKYIFMLEDKEYKLEDLRGISKDELNSLQSKLIEIKKDLNLENPEVVIEISEAYDANIKGWKYIFSKTTQIDNNGSNFEMITTKRYTLEKQDGKWKIINVDSSMLPYSKDQKRLDELMSKLKYQTVNNEKVEYVKTFNFSDIYKID